MSEDHIEFVRQLIEANNSDDVGAAIDTHVALADSRVEFSSILTAVEVEAYRATTASVATSRTWPTRGRSGESNLKTPLR